ncbi:MAG: hypothetical protein RW306_11710 [Geobacteraceae bacterium]|nr:hypothetical protein [Geobacteraceae bacterium]
MALVNHAKKEINAKIIYFGPVGCGKSAALNYIYSRIKPELRGELKSVSAGGDNLLFFDFSPLDAPLQDGYRVRLHIYTLTGAVTNPATWKMTLKGADGIVIMIDSSPDRLLKAQESLSQLRDYLSAYGVGLHDTPAILQVNESGNSTGVIDDSELAFKLDLPGIMVCRSWADSGKGVLDAVTSLFKQVMERVATVENRNDTITCPATTAVSNEQEFSEDIESGDGTDVIALKSEPADSPRISISAPDATVEGTVVRIPLEISLGGSRRRLTISVSVDLE